MGSLGIFGFGKKKNAVSGNPVRTSDRFDNVSPGGPLPARSMPLAYHHIIIYYVQHTPGAGLHIAHGRARTNAQELWTV